LAVATNPPPGQGRRAEGLVVLVAALVAAVSARGYAGGPNDGSRLATAESLVDYHTFAIDESIFVKVPPRTAPAQTLPYPLSFHHLPDHGTVDKVLVGGRFYSEKPPVPALWMAGLYRGLQGAAGLRARERADYFCYALTLGSSGLAYVMAVWGICRVGRILRLRPGPRLGLAASFALSTLALPYTRHVNGHIVLLALAVWLFAVLAAVVPGAARRDTPAPAWGLLTAGTLTGLAYSVEQPTGGLLLAGTLAVLTLCRPWQRSLALAGVAALPWALLHHAIVYGCAGTLRPVNTHPEFFAYEGSEFNATNLTGFWNHRGAGELLEYAGGLMVGPRGFLLSNLPLLLAVPAAGFLLRRLPRERPLLLLACGWGAGTWLTYAVLSNNYAGACCSVRWFVPLLAAGYYLLALLVREYPGYRADFLVLSAWGAVLAGLMWREGPWGYALPLFWPVQGAALTSWALCRLWRWRHDTASPRPATA
jgi:hypothetical protein